MCVQAKKEVEIVSWIGLMRDVCPKIQYGVLQGACKAFLQPARGERFMSRLQPVATTKVKSIGAGLVVAIVVLGGLLSGCGGGGSDSTESAGQGAKTEIEAGTEKVEEGVSKGTKEAEELIEEAKDKVENGEGSAKVREGLQQLENGVKEGKLQGEAAVEETKKKIKELTK